MPDKKYNGLRFIFVGFIVAIFVAVLMCGVTIRQEIIRLSNPRKQVVNTAGAAARPVPLAPRRYPTPAEAAAQAPAAPEAPRLFNTLDTAYLRFRTLQGGWQAKGMDEQGIWVLVVELRENEAVPGEFSGYTTLTNFLLGPPAGMGRSSKDIAKLVARMSPKVMILVGTVEQGVISFHVKKTVGESECPFTSLVLTPFGNTGLMAEWNFACRSGQGLMMRNGK